jgi:hypothetical protein
LGERADPELAENLLAVILDRVAAYTQELRDLR